MSIARDHYEVLGVPRNATVRQIRAAYVERARRAQPDLVGQRGLDVMRLLNEAWAVLKDTERRAALGIGLAACKRVVESLRGRLWAESRAGGGSEVGFALSRD